MFTGHNVHLYRILTPCSPMAQSNLLAGMHAGPGELFHALRTLFFITSQSWGLSQVRLPTIICKLWLWYFCVGKISLDLLVSAGLVLDTFILHFQSTVCTFNSVLRLCCIVKTTVKKKRKKVGILI